MSRVSVGATLVVTPFSHRGGHRHQPASREKGALKAGDLIGVCSDAFISTLAPPLILSQSVSLSVLNECGEANARKSDNLTLAAG